MFFFLSFRPLLYLFNHLDWLFLGLLQNTIDIFGLFTEQQCWQYLGSRKKAFDKKYHIIGNILHYNYCVIIYIVTITNKTLFSYNHFIYILAQNKFLAKFHGEETSRVREYKWQSKGCLLDSLLMKGISNNSMTVRAADGGGKWEKK